MLRKQVAMFTRCPAVMPRGRPGSQTSKPQFSKNIPTTCTMIGLTEYSTAPGESSPTTGRPRLRA
jgi:hypothetical protein